MSGTEMPDELMAALAELHALEPDPRRSDLILARAGRTIARRRRLADRRLVLAGIVYGRGLAPFAAGALGAGFVASAIAQAALVLLRAHAGVFLP